jgi:hypothetical protein
MGTFLTAGNLELKNERDKYSFMLVRRLEIFVSAAANSGQFARLIVEVAKSGS